MKRNREQFDIEINVRQMLLVLKRRWMFIAIGAFLGGVFGGIVPTLNSPVYTATGTMRFVNQRAISVGDISQETNILQPSTPMSNPLATELLMMQSRPVLKTVIETLDLRTEEGAPLPPAMLAENMSVEILPSTDVVRVSYISERPQEAAAVANTLIETYIESNIRTHRAQAEATREFIEQQLPDVEAELEGVELALRRFKERHNLVSIEQEADGVSQKLVRLESQIQDQEQSLLQINTQLSFLSRELGLTAEEAIAANALSQSSGVRSVYEELQLIEQQLAAQQARFTEENPTVISLRARQQQLQRLLDQRIRDVTDSDRAIDDLSVLDVGAQEQGLREALVQNSLTSMSLSRSLTELQAEMARSRQRAQQLPSLEQQQRELERKLQAAQMTYETLLAGLQEARVKENQEVGNVRIVAPALVPVLPSNMASIISIELIAGLTLGVGLGLSFGILLELLDNSLRTEYEARNYFKRYPILGTIPVWTEDDWQLSEYGTQPETANFDLPLMLSSIPPENPLYPVSIAYRRLQTNLKLLGGERRLRIIALTSSAPGEGKSVTAANLALALANLSHRVLLLEADLAAPQQHKIWKLSNVWGLSNILQDQIAPEQAIQPVAETLDVLSAGVGAPGVVALLDSDRMGSTVRRLSEVYDYVIVDSPSLLVAPELISISQLADGVVMVVRPGVLSKSDAVAAQETLNNTGINILGIIVNGVLKIQLRTPTSEAVSRDRTAEFDPTSTPIPTPTAATAAQRESGVDETEADEETLVESAGGGLLARIKRTLGLERHPFEAAETEAAGARSSEFAIEDELDTETPAVEAAAPTTESTVVETPPGEDQEVETLVEQGAAKSSANGHTNGHHHTGNGHHSGVNGRHSGVNGHSSGVNGEHTPEQNDPSSRPRRLSAITRPHEDAER
jgi:capsular exopolysaccharide synthesis family protein